MRYSAYWPYRVEEHADCRPPNGRCGSETYITVGALHSSKHFQPSTRHQTGLEQTWQHPSLWWGSYTTGENWDMLLHKERAPNCEIHKICLWVKVSKLKLLSPSPDTRFKTSESHLSTWTTTASWKSSMGRAFGYPKQLSAILRRGWNEHEGNIAVFRSSLWQVKDISNTAS
jgi:hypothetical protein